MTSVVSRSQAVNDRIMCYQVKNDRARGLEASVLFNAW